MTYRIWGKKEFLFDQVRCVWLDVFQLSLLYKCSGNLAGFKFELHIVKLHTLRTTNIVFNWYTTILNIFVAPFSNFDTFHWTITSIATMKPNITTNNACRIQQKTNIILYLLLLTLKQQHWDYYYHHLYPVHISVTSVWQILHWSFYWIKIKSTKC